MRNEIKIKESNKESLDMTAVFYTAEDETTKKSGGFEATVAGIEQPSPADSIAELSKIIHQSSVGATLFNCVKSLVGAGMIYPHYFFFSQLCFFTC